jgi:hypothetical protein
VNPEIFNHLKAKNGRDLRCSPIAIVKKRFEPKFSAFFSKPAPILASEDQMAQAW